MERTEPGTIVKMTYKTGRYIGEVAEGDGRRLLVKVLAVLAHPEQGDLHHPGDPDVPMFHERKAASYTEKVWIPAGAAVAYDGAIPPYRESLETAIGVEMERLEQMKRWAARSLEALEQVRKDYGFH